MPLWPSVMASAFWRAPPGVIAPPPPLLRPPPGPTAPVTMAAHILAARRMRTGNRHHLASADGEVATGLALGIAFRGPQPAGGRHHIAVTNALAQGFDVRVVGVLPQPRAAHALFELVIRRHWASPGNLHPQNRARSASWHNARNARIPHSWSIPRPRPVAGTSSRSSQTAASRFERLRAWL